MSDLSHLTAIKRSTLSKPTRWLHRHNKLVGRVLDYGCGRGDDAARLKLEKYDPHFFPELPAGQFDTIICNYVLNVVPPNIADHILSHINQILSPQGMAYVTVRRDIKKEGLTRRGTFQRTVKLSLPIVFEDRGCAIYLLSKTIGGADGS